MNRVRYHTAWVAWHARALAAVCHVGETYTATGCLPLDAAARRRARGDRSGPVNLTARRGLSWMDGTGREKRAWHASHKARTHQGPELRLRAVCCPPRPPVEDAQVGGHVVGVARHAGSVKGHHLDSLGGGHSRFNGRRHGLGCPYLVETILPCETGQRERAKACQRLAWCRGLISRGSGTLRRMQTHTCRSGESLHMTRLCGTPSTVQATASSTRLAGPQPPALPVVVGGASHREQ